MSSFPGSGLILTAIFGALVATTLGGAVLAVASARIIRSVCGLALSCIGLAGLFYFLHSPFLALMEILIYVGAVCITIIFAIMLAEPDDQPKEERKGAAMLASGFALLIGAGVFWGLFQLGRHHHWAAPVQRINDGSVEAIGISMLTTYSMAFELISLALLVAILGALVIARYGKTKA